jgi:hypothetical protein
MKKKGSRVCWGWLTFQESLHRIAVPATCMRPMEQRCLRLLDPRSTRKSLCFLRGRGRLQDSWSFRLTEGQPDRRQQRQEPRLHRQDRSCQGFHSCHWRRDSDGESAEHQSPCRKSPTPWKRPQHTHQRGCSTSSTAHTGGWERPCSALRYCSTFQS